MLNMNDILETIHMIEGENLDIRTITMGIALLDCVSDDADRFCDKIYDKITRKAEKLVSVGEEIEKMYGIPIVNKRVSVTPIAIAGGALSQDGFLKAAKALDRAADTLGINFIGGFGALHRATAICLPPFRRRLPKRARSAPPSMSRPQKPASIWMRSSRWAISSGRRHI